MMLAPCAPPSCLTLVVVSLAFRTAVYGQGFT